MKARTKERLAIIESFFNPSPLIVLAEIQPGEQKTMTVSEMFRIGAGFCKVIAGGNVRDLSRILDSVQTAAEAMTEDPEEMTYEKWLEEHDNEY